MTYLIEKGTASTCLYVRLRRFRGRKTKQFSHYNTSSLHLKKKLNFSIKTKRKLLISTRASCTTSPWSVFSLQHPRQVEQRAEERHLLDLLDLLLGEEEAHLDDVQEEEEHDVDDADLQEAGSVDLETVC